MKRLFSIDLRLVVSLLFLGGVGEFLIRVFGEGNLLLHILTLFFMLVEMFTCMVIGFLGKRKEDQFGFHEVLEFWVKRSILLCLPLIGSGVDWAWHWASEPDTMLGSELQRYTSRAIAIGLFSYQIKQVLLNVLKVYKNFPLAMWAIRLMDRMDHIDPPPEEFHNLNRRASDSPTRREVMNDEPGVSEVDGGGGAIPGSVGNTDLHPDLGER